MYFILNLYYYFFYKNDNIIKMIMIMIMIILMSHYITIGFIKIFYLKKRYINY